MAGGAGMEKKCLLFNMGLSPGPYFLSPKERNLLWSEAWHTIFNPYFIIYLTNYQLAHLLFLVHLFFKLWRYSMWKRVLQIPSDLSSLVSYRYFFRLWICALCQSSVQNEKARDTRGSAMSITLWVQYLHMDCRHVKDQNNIKPLCS